MHKSVNENNIQILNRIYADNKNILYSTILSEFQRLMYWILILKKFGPNIQHISGVDNIMEHPLRIFQYTTNNDEESNTSQSQCFAKKLYKNRQDKDYGRDLPLDIYLVHR